MEFRTSIKLDQQAHGLIDYNSDLFMIGSCFAQKMSYRLNYFQFRNLTNPFGILFHPVAIERVITRALNDEFFDKTDCFEMNERWFSFEGHSYLNGRTARDLTERLNDKLKETKSQLESATHLVITLGTAWVYRHISTDTIVANCHKVPQKEFSKELLTVEEISESVDSIIKLIRLINKEIRVILTVSPVRHLKDGMIENSRSKAHLLAGVHQIVNKRDGIHYFPSYEIMMDDLRDYRFYEGDMLHPNSLAIQYIWDQFQETWIDEKCYAVMEEVDKVSRGFAHKPFRADSQGYKDFLKKNMEHADKLKAKYPHFSFD
ncbi:MAG: GSCFA domain-containing protein [Bacteroidia bacterium]|nr:GSCFA domain-containing protein [Bacteroidia bacterium]